MIAKHVKDFGKLRMNDIIQYLILPEVAEITGNPELAYKTFFLKGNPKVGGKNKKIEFTNDVPDEITKDEHLNMSFDVLQEEKDKGMTISKVNPAQFRELQYMVVCSPDVLNPRSEDLERAWATEEYDRMIMHPEVFDPTETGKLLLGANPTTKKDVEKYIAKQPTPGMNPPEMGGMPNAGNSPLNAVNKKSPLSPTGASPILASLGSK